MPRVAKDTNRTKDEHIFPESKIRPLVLNWKRLIDEDKTWEAMDLLEVIIADSTEMFKRLAQHEKIPSYRTTRLIGGSSTGENS